MSRTKAWIEAMRLRTLPVSVAGVIAGTGCAAYYSSFRWIPAAICLLFAIIAQVASNFANEYYDFKNGLDRKGREGFRRGVTEGDISPGSMKNATFGLLVLDALLGCCLLFYGGWWLILVGIAVALFAVGYSTGPYPLSHHGLGDVAVVVFFGFVPVTLTCYVQTGVWDWESISIPISIAIGLLASNVLIVNNYRDYEDDAAVGKNTTVVIFGRGVMSCVYLLSGIAATVILFATLYFAGARPLWIVFIVILLAVASLWFDLKDKRGRKLNPVLGKTAMTLLLVSIIVAVSLLP